VLFAARLAPTDLELRRAARLQEALNRKCLKLQQCKDEGVSTVLILEDSDIFLSNHVLIGEALAGLLAQRPNLPDHIYLVETALDSWDVRLLKDEENIVPEGDWTEFDSAQLKDITGQ
jgi:hypothetical protein